MSADPIASLSVPETVDRIKHAARTLDLIFNGQAKGADRKNGFVLLVFPFGTDPDARCNYISNGADRGDIVVLMKEMIARFEGQPEMKGSA